MVTFSVVVNLSYL